MDPRANIEEQWEIIRRARERRFTWQGEFDEANDRLMELREAYISWMGKGGYKIHARSTNHPPSIEAIHAAGFQIYQPY